LDESGQGKYINAIVDSLKEARKAILHGLKRPDAGIALKTVMGDVTKLIDKIAEDTIINCLKKHLKDFQILSEEAGRIRFGSGSGPIFIIDPLDGSTNALRGYPCFSVSIAAALKPRLSSIIAGGVINVVTGDIFIAVKGKGAKLNGKPIKPSKVTKIEDALIAADLNIRSKIPNYLAKVCKVIEKAKHFRFIGTDALETCFVAAGICDAFMDLRGSLRITDFAAACFIVKEAGGLVVNEKGEPLDLEFEGNVRGKYIAACTSDLLNEILNKLED